MFDEVGHPVIELIRLRFGPLSLGALASGDVREATAREIAALRTIADRAKVRDANGEDA
jgi:16S rRNA U516 pseudouridylate synthase RsuA-like enzyme